MDLLKNGFPELPGAAMLAHAGSEKEFYSLLVKIIDELIERDFARLLQVLYQVDVDEHRLKHLLQQNTDKKPAEIIATLLLERQKQKLALRGQLTISSDNIPDDERW